MIRRCVVYWLLLFWLYVLSGIYYCNLCDCDSSFFFVPKDVIMCDFVVVVLVPFADIYGYTF